MTGLANSAIVLTATLAIAALMVWPPLARAVLWRAMLTPLASIIGSGFLVLGPLLLHAYGAYAPLAMLGLCGLAYLYGHVIRGNIHSLDAGRPDAPAIRMLETASSWALALAYVISVTYYLNLFGSFGVSLTDEDPLNARILTSAVLVMVGAVGAIRGFQGLERLEQVSVGLKLAIIGGLLAGFLMFFFEQVGAAGLVANPVGVSGISALTLGFGLLITVQGFETSRYLGAEYSAGVRISSMRLAQLLASAIYLTYVVLIAYVFPVDQVATNETAIIGLTVRVAPVLPVLLVAAALAAQLSAALADTGGSGGLVHELSGGRIPPALAYVLLAAAGLAMTWSLNVFEIIAWASRAFALYYALQAAIGFAVARKQGVRVGSQALYIALAILGLAIAGFGTTVE
ncbi:MAG: hypothetical protein LJE68_18230 [Rhodobacter sp.]|nr:hypothetical protein [Rhodobacter sp.]